MVIHTRILAVHPTISEEQLQRAVLFASSVMREARDEYSEPVCLLRVDREPDFSLVFSVRTLYSHNVAVYSLDAVTLDTL